MSVSQLPAAPSMREGINVVGFFSKASNQDVTTPVLLIVLGVLLILLT